MAKYRKKPVVIEAEQFNYHPEQPKGAKYGAKTGDMFMEFPIWVDKDGFHLFIPTLEGEHRVNVGDWIITGIKGEKYPCTRNIFAATYELA